MIRTLFAIGLLLTAIHLVGCGEGTDSAPLAANQGICVDSDGSQHQVGESWDCADGCNSCACRWDSTAEKATISSTLMSCSQ